MEGLKRQVILCGSAGKSWEVEAYALRICKPKLYTRQMKKEEIFTMTMKKMISLALAACMALALAAPVAAATVPKQE